MDILLFTFWGGVVLLLFFNQSFEEQWNSPSTDDEMQPWGGSPNHSRQNFSWEHQGWALSSGSKDRVSDFQIYLLSITIYIMYYLQ